MRVADALPDVRRGLLFVSAFDRPESGGSAAAGTTKKAAKEKSVPGQALFRILIASSTAAQEGAGAPGQGLLVRMPKDAA
jgi:hypothetical protein